MGRHPLCLLLLSAFVASSLAISAVPTTNTSYVVVTSDVLVPGSELLIDIHLLDLVQSDSKEEDKEPDECILELSVSADEHLWHRSVWKIELEKTPKSFSKTLKVMVQSDENALGMKSVLKIESSSCFNFSRSVEIPTGRRELLVSILTDKLKYRPGELVMVDSLVLTQELKPHLKPFNLSIHNSKDAMFFKWFNAEAEEGVSRNDYFIPLIASPDEMVLSFESHKQVVNHTFQIREKPEGPYDKEHFLVEVRCPRYHTLRLDNESESPNLDLIVSASLHSGVPLKGKVELQLSLGNDTNIQSLPPADLVAGYKEFSLKPDEIKQILNMKPEEPLVGREIKVSVKVEEMRPLREERSTDDGEKGEETKKEGDKMEERNSTLVPVIKNVLVTFVDQSHVLFFSQFTPVFFKPGLTYIGQVLLKPVEEILPISSEEKEVTVIVKHFTRSSKGPREEKLTLKMKPDSLGEFSFRVPKEDTRLELEAHFEDKEYGKIVEAHLKGLVPFSTKNKIGHFVQVLMDQKPPKLVVGETLEVEVECSFPTSEILYQVISQSGLILSGRLVTPHPAEKHNLSLVLPQNVSHLLASPRLVVEVVSPSSEILSDSLRFVVEQQKECPLEVLVKSEVVELGEIVELVVKAEPFTDVYLLTVSDPLVFESKEQELRKLTAHEKMSRYLGSLNSSYFTRTMEEFGGSISTIPSLAPDSQRVHNESESNLLSDGILFADPRKPWPISPRKNGTLDDLEPSSLDIIEEFDLKMWRLNVSVGPSGEETLRLVLPAKARLYTVAAYGVRPGKNLLVVDRIVQFMSTSKVLASLRHPEFLMRGEELLMEVHLFNNQDKEAKVEVTMKETGLRKKRENVTAERIEREVVLKPNELGVVTVPFKISPIRQKSLKFEVEVFAEGVRHKLNSSIALKYQGHPVMIPESLILDNFNGQQVLEVDMTRNITSPVENSERAIAILYGHPLGPAIECMCQHKSESRNLEGTKLWFALATNVAEHISNNSLFQHNYEQPDSSNDLMVRDECVESMRDSLQYQLEMKNEDGSYSIYPKQSGDVSLTSFMLDSTVLLRKVIPLDKDDVAKTVEWLSKQQHENGSFIEEAKDELQKDERPHHVPLTSQVVASLIEACDSFDLPKELEKLVESVTNKSVEYVEQIVLRGDLDNDPYSLNLAAYALTLAKSDKLFEVLRRRNRLMSHEDDEECWRVGEGESNAEQSSSVTATSYAILTSLAMNDVNGATLYVNFLLRSMNLAGIFVRAEDTHAALKALSQYFRLYNDYHEHEQVNVDVDIILSNKKRHTVKILSPFYAGSLFFDHSNIKLASPLKVESSGKGVILLQSVAAFNEAIQPIGPTSFDLKVEETRRDSEHLRLKVCAENLEKEPLDNLVIEMTLLSGYELNLQKFQRKSSKLVLRKEDKVFLFLNPVNSSELACEELCMDRLYEVGDLAPRFIKLFSSDEQDKSVIKPYGGDKVESS